MILKEVCQYLATAKAKRVCGNPALYRIGWEQVEGVVRWIPICGIHDYVVGINNLKAAYGLTHTEAAKLNRTLKEEADAAK